MRLKTPLTTGVIGLLLTYFVTAAGAGVFSVTPVRIYMTPKDRAIAVTITNEGDEELVMQADLFLWKQKPGGQEDLTLTEDMFLSPPIIKLAPKSRQVVRLARLSNARPTEQLTYRMIVREIPEARPAKQDLQVQIALAFSLPVFITPPGATRIYPDLTRYRRQARDRAGIRYQGGGQDCIEGAAEADGG